MSKNEEDGKDISILPSGRFVKTNGIGIALSGGLARGFAHIGVLKTLLKAGIKPEIVTGTSIGAVVGGCYLMDRLDEIEEWALSLNRMKVLSYLDFRVRSAGLIGGKKLMALLESHFDDSLIEDIPLPYVAIATNLLTGHEVWLRRGRLIDAMRASFALPGVFPPVERNHRLLIDGALVNPIPIGACQAMGSRMTIAVDLNCDVIGQAVKPGQRYQTIAGFDMFDDSDVPKEEQKKASNPLTKRLFRRESESPSLFGVMVSSLGIMQDRLTRVRIASDPPDIHIKPHVGHIGLMEFERAKELIQAGEFAAEAALPDLRAAIEVMLPPEEDE